MEPPAISAADYDYGAFRSEENIFAEGNVVHVLRHLRYDRHEMHSHDFFEIAYGVSGNGLVTLADRKIQLGAGDIIFFSPGTEHKLTADSDDTVILKIIMRRGDFDCIYRDVLRSDSPLSAFFRASLEKSGGGWLMFRAGGDDELLDIMLKMRFSEVRRGRVDNILKEALAMQVFCILVNDHAESARVSFGSDVTGKIIIHISSHFEDITLDKLSRVFHFTPEYISKLVRKVLHVARHRAEARGGKAAPYLDGPRSLGNLPLGRVRLQRVLLQEIPRRKRVQPARMERTAPSKS